MGDRTMLTIVWPHLSSSHSFPLGGVNPSQVSLSDSLN